MQINVLETIAKTTERLTWVSSGVAAASISSALRDNSDALVSSIAATSSGNGFYYALMTMPGSSCWCVNEWIAVIGVNTYVYRQNVHVNKLEVD